MFRYYLYESNEVLLCLNIKITNIHNNNKEVTNFTYTHTSTYELIVFVQKRKEKI